MNLSRFSNKSTRMKIIKKHLKLLAGDTAVDGPGYRCPNTVLQFTGDQFLAMPGTLVSAESDGERSCFRRCRGRDDSVRWISTWLEMLGDTEEWSERAG